jgi:hypothetical protein
MADKQLVFQVAVGETPSFYGPCLSSVAEYCKKHNFKHVVLDKPQLRIVPKNSKRSVNALRLGYLPIFEKSVGFGLDASRVAIIDADIFIRDGAPDIFADSGTDFAGVIEREMPLLPHYRDKVRKYSEGQYRSLTEVDWRWNQDGAEYFNMGCMVLGEGFRDYLDGQTPTEFLHRPEFERFVNGEGHFKWSTDQTLLNYFVKKSGMSVTNLDWRWNALYGAVRDIEQAYFVHFFLSSKMPRGGAEIPDIIGRL